jgi:hypothetical protein
MYVKAYAKLTPKYNKFLGVISKSILFFTDLAKRKVSFITINKENTKRNTDMKFSIKH